MRITPVPLHEADLIRRGVANGFTVTEAWSPPRKIPAHAHADFSITILLQGAFEERYRPIHRPRSCRPGTVLLRPAGEVHENHLDTSGARTLSIEVSPSRLELSGKRLAPLLTLATRCDAAFLDVGLAMSRELRLADEAAGLALESLSLELLARLLRLANSAGSRPPPPWLGRARDAMHDRFRGQSLRVSGLAAEQGVHPVYFARAFRRHFGVTPGQYLRRLRLESAHERIARSTEPLATVALNSGFADQSHLTRAFRRSYALSPGELRRASHRSSRERFRDGSAEAVGEAERDAKPVRDLMRDRERVNRGEP